MSLLIDQLNTDNDVLYLIGDIVTKFKQETERNKQVYNGIVDDLNYVFHTVDENRFTIFQLHSCVSSVRSQPLDRYRRGRHVSMYRFHKLFSGYKYTRYKDNRVRHPIENLYSMELLRDYIGCSYPKIHLANKLPRAIYNWVQFFHIYRYRYEDIQNKVCRHKAGIKGWHACQY